MHTKELYLPRLISDGMVLQCDRETHIWGWSAPKKEIVIYLTDGNEVEISEKLICFAGEDGRWDCTLPSMPACTKVSMKITTGNNYATRWQRKAEYQYQYEAVCKAVRSGWPK